jgi:hypothetical protein
VLKARQLIAHTPNKATPLNMQASPTMSNPRRTTVSSALDRIDFAIIPDY